jgi:hypothetical protein
MQLMDNYKELWFNDEEYEAMRQKNRRLVHRVENNLTGGRKYCIRGLEGLIKGDDTPSRVETRNIAWDSVLDEQDTQIVLGEFNDEKIATMYKLSTERSKLEAARRARVDEQDARAYISAPVRIIEP